MATESQIRQLCATRNQFDAARLATAINEAMAAYNINTPRGVRYFIAQSAFETAYYQHFVESLIYTTPERLVAVWPSRFTMSQQDTSKAYAPNYIRNEQKLANLVYAGRNGNGNEQSGDGFNYRGRGGFHLTGKGNYAKASMDIYGDYRLVDNPDQVGEYEVGMITAAWFWTKNGLGELADQDEFTKVTRVINGSTVTVPDRLLVLDKVNDIF